jgi:hypothetical protein
MGHWDKRGRDFIRNRCFERMMAMKELIGYINQQIANNERAIEQKEPVGCRADYEQGAITALKLIKKYIKNKKETVQESLF